MIEPDLRRRSIRTLAWLGDAEFEREVRLRLSRRGDWPTDKLDKLRARIVNAEAQAAMLKRMTDSLTEAELAVVQRGRNTDVRGSGRRRNVKAYRAATGFEALIAWWSLGDPEQRARMDALLYPAIERRLDELFASKTATK